MPPKLLGAHLAHFLDDKLSSGNRGKDWRGNHARAPAQLGNSPEAPVPHNTTSGVPYLQPWDFQFFKEFLLCKGVRERKPESSLKSILPGNRFHHVYDCSQCFMNMLKECQGIFPWALQLITYSECFCSVPFEMCCALILIMYKNPPARKNSESVMLVK